MQTPAFFATYFAAILLVWIVGIGLTVIMTISLWKIFNKAYERGWYAIIPVLNNWKFYEISTGHGGLMFIPAISSGIAAGILMNLGQSAESGLMNTSSVSTLIFMSILVVVLLVGGNIVYFVALFKLAKKFGKSVGFCIGTMFLPFIFLPIIAFGKSVYTY